MYAIIRNSTRNLTKPKHGWGNSPSESDINTADDIERIRIGRNRICHENALNMETSEFNESVLDLIWAIRRLSMDDVKLMGDVCDVMNKVFTKGEIMEGMIEQLKEFQKEVQNWEQLYQNEAPVPQEDTQLIYQRSGNEDIKIHPAHDSDILLKDNGTLAIKNFKQGNGICFMDRPLKIGEKVQIRGAIYGFNVYHLLLTPLKIGVTNINPETMFAAKYREKAVMGRLHIVNIPRNCGTKYKYWYGYPFHLCISLCPNGSLLVSCNLTDKKDRYANPEVSINAQLWLVFELLGAGSVWISKH